MVNTIGNFVKNIKLSHAKKGVVTTEYAQGAELLMLNY